MEEVFKRIYKIQSKDLKNLERENKKFLIVFAEVPGSGKTTIAMELEKILGGIRINSIDVEKIYQELGNVRNIEKKREYILWLMGKISKDFKNKLIILDKGIDRTYKEIAEWVQENEYKLFIIDLDCSRKELEKRLMKREGGNAQNYLAEMDRWFREHEEFQKLGLADVKINTEDGDLSVWREIILKKLKSFF